MTSNYFGQHITEYTNFLHYPIKGHVTKASALEFTFVASKNHGLGQYENIHTYKYILIKSKIVDHLKQNISHPGIIDNSAIRILLFFFKIHVAYLEPSVKWVTRAVRRHRCSLKRT